MTPQRPLGDRVREHYGDQHMRSEALARLRAIGRAHPVGRLPSRRAVHVTTAAGAVAILALVFGLLLPYRSADRVASGGRTAALIAEVATSHLAAHAPELVASSYAELSGMAARLGFAPRESERLAAEGLTLAGARHVSLGGEPAAQLFLTDAHGDTLTLYQMRAAGAPAAPARMVRDRLLVRVWKEGEHLYAIARAAR